MSPFGPLDRRLSPPPEPGRIAWLPGTTFAHRGMHGAATPENSLAAFRAAIARGYGIECDVQLSRDGQAMVFHDWTLDRLTGTEGATRHRTAAELGALTLAGGEEHVPTLRLLLDLVAGRVPLLIEVKSKREIPVNPIANAVRRALEGYRGAHGVMSFDPRVAHWFARRSPHTPRGLVVTEADARTLSGTVRRHAALWHARPDFLAYDVRDLPSRFAAAQRRRGLPVATWTVRDATLRERALTHADAPIAEGAGII